MRTDRVDAEEKQKIAVLAATGKSQRAIARATGRDNKTVAKVLKEPEVICMKADAQDRLVGKYEQLAEEVLDSVTYADLEKASLRDKAIASGTFLDKSRVIRGQATSNQSVFFHIVMESDRAEEPDQQD